MSTTAALIQDLFLTDPRDKAIELLHNATAIYTAEPVVSELLSRINWPSGDKKLLDPGNGDGIFADCALRKLLNTNPTINPDKVPSILKGWEVYPLAAQDARRRLRKTLIGHGWTEYQAKKTASEIIINADFLTENPGTDTFDYICGNPPYIRMCNVPQPIRNEYESILPDYATNDLLHSFLDKCVKLLNPNGEIAFITSDRWLFNMTAATLRYTIGKKVGIRHIKRLNPDTAFYKPKTRRSNTPPRVHPVEIIMQYAKAGIPINSEPFYPDAINDPEYTGKTLSDIATIKLGPWVGKEGLFIVNAETAAKLPAECLVPAVDTDDLINGEVVIGRKFAIRTYPGTKPHPKILEHLEKNIYRLSTTGKRRKDWWTPPEAWHNEKLDTPAFLIPKIATGLKYYHLPAGVLAVNHNILIVATAEENTERVEKLLQSQQANEWIQKRSARLENDFYQISTTRLKQLPIEL